MPTVYVSANFEASVNLDAEQEFAFGEWTDKKLAKQREDNNKPNKGIWLEITNPEDSSEVFPIPVTDKDIYEGVLDVVRDGRNFLFKFNGKAKVSVHKLTKEKIDLGLKPKVSGLMINGQQSPVDIPIDVAIGSKKI